MSRRLLPDVLCARRRLLEGVEKAAHICCGLWSRRVLSFAACPTQALLFFATMLPRIKVCRASICAYDGGNMNVGEEVADGSAIVGFIHHDCRLHAVQPVPPAPRSSAHHAQYRDESVPVGQAVGGVPMAALPSTAVAGGVPVVTAQPVCYPGGCGQDHVHHPAAMATAVGMSRWARAWLPRRDDDGRDERAGVATEAIEEVVEITAVEAMAEDLPPTCR